MMEVLSHEMCSPPVPGLMPECLFRVFTWDGSAILMKELPVLLQMPWARNWHTYKKSMVWYGIYMNKLQAGYMALARKGTESKAQP